MLTVRLIVSTILVILTTPSFATLLFSEYVEGSGYNKALEIFNPGTDIDLAAESYSIEIYSNGAASASYSFDLSGVMTQNSTLVISHSRADDLLQAQANLVTGSLNFNGDDAIVLLRNGEVLDRIGQMGVDPGSEWGSGPVSTQNHTLRRQMDVLTGDNNALAAFDPALQWLGYEIDVFDGLGSHAVSLPSRPPVEPVNVAVPAPASLLLLVIGLLLLGLNRLINNQLYAGSPKIRANTVFA